MRKKYSDVQRELVDDIKSDKNLKARSEFLKEQLFLYKERQKRMVIEYERVIDMWKTTYVDLLNNWHKILIAKVLMWYNKAVDRFKQCYG